MARKSVGGKMFKRGAVVPNLSVAAGCLVGLLTLQVACSGNPESTLPGNHEFALPGAVYAKVVPAYPGAKYVGTVGGHSNNSIGGTVPGKSRSWFFTISDPAEKVLAFYKKKLPDAKMSQDETGVSTFTLIPSGAQEGERVQVIFRKGGYLQIRELLNPGKKPG
jgi:hypothetical protein